MAAIIEKKLKDGSSAFKVQVQVTDKGTGKVSVKAKTWHPDPTKSKRANDKALQEFVLEFEKAAKQDSELGIADKSTMTVEGYSKIWLEYVRQNKSPTYYASCVTHLAAINKSLGRYKLIELSPVIIQRYIDEINAEDLSEIEIRSDKLESIFKERGLTKHEFSRETGINRTTLLKVERGGNIEYATAERIAKGLDMEINEVFNIKKRTHEYSSSSRAKRYRTLRAMLSYAMRQQYIDKNFATGDYIEPIKEVNKPREFLDDVEIRELLSHIETYSNRQAKAAIKTVIFTGLRRGEVCGLEWRDIDFDNRVMHIERASKTATGMGVITGSTKTANSNRTIVMPQALVEELKDYKQWWDKFTFLLGNLYTGCQRLFLQSDGTPLYPSTVGKWLKKILEEYDMKELSLHSLRHSNITIQLAAGIPIKTVSARAGHSSTKVTADIYAHMIKSSDREAADALDSILG